MGDRCAGERVTREGVAEHWPVWAKLLEPVPRAGLYTLEHVRAWLDAGTWQLWAIFDMQDGSGPEPIACIVTSVEAYPLGRVGRVLECAGTDLADWIDLLPELEDAFREAQCEVVELYGRRGWERVLGREGYRAAACVLRKEIA